MTTRNFKIRTLLCDRFGGSIIVRREYQLRLVIVEGKKYVGIDGEREARDWLKGTSQLPLSDWEEE